MPKIKYSYHKQTGLKSFSWKVFSEATHLHHWLPTHHRSNHQKSSINIAVLQYFALFAGEHLCWSLFLIKLQTLRLLHRCFSVNIAKFSRTPILKNICERLLLTSSTTFLMHLWPKIFWLVLSITFGVLNTTVLTITPHKTFFQTTIIFLHFIIIYILYFKSFQFAASPLYIGVTIATGNILQWFTKL